MINLAIVIAVSEYIGKENCLPGCVNDGEAIATIIRGDPRFNDLLYIHSNTTSAHVKASLIDFVSKYRGQDIGDLFFYFSGHGDFTESDFYYLLSDFASTRRKQTSLENSELDQLARALSPKLFVKVVDACHAGVAYIKAGESLKKYLDASAAEFKKLYFMFSSQMAQGSYQDTVLSYFTRRFIEAIALRAEAAIRYKDIIDYISDAFQVDASRNSIFCYAGRPCGTIFKRSRIPQKSAAAIYCDHGHGLPSKGLSFCAPVVSDCDCRAGAILLQ